MKIKLPVYAFLITIISTTTVLSQNSQNYSYKSQKEFIHPDLGKVYLGMSLKDFTKIIDLSAADAGANRFDFVSLQIPVNKKNISQIVIKAKGIPYELQKEIIRREDVMQPDGYTIPVYRIDASKIPDDAFVYQISVFFNTGYDLKQYAFKTFGEKSGTHHNPADDYKFYDSQWTKKTADGLNWLIRVFYNEEPLTLQLIGRIPGTEWDPNDW